MTTRDVTRERGSRGMLDGTRETLMAAQTVTSFSSPETFSCFITCIPEINHSEKKPR